MPVWTAERNVFPLPRMKRPTTATVFRQVIQMPVRQRSAALHVRIRHDPSCRTIHAPVSTVWAAIKVCHHHNDFQDTEKYSRAAPRNTAL